MREDTRAGLSGYKEGQRVFRNEREGCLPEGEDRGIRAQQLLLSGSSAVRGRPEEAQAGGSQVGA